MRICYIARHGQIGVSNDDEGAIAYALRVLGHEVTEVHEGNAEICRTDGYDLLLFHKLDSIPALERFKGVCPRAFWYFDLVDWPNDPRCAGRNITRREWMMRTIPHIDVGFCTDGDWVDKWRDITKASDGRPDDTLKVLRQGADERVTGRGKYPGPTPPPRILFVGGRASSSGRAEFVQAMKERYGPMFWHINSGVYGRELAEQIAGSRVVVCPDSPVTFNYWSNRVYMMAGFAGCVVHPYCAKLMPAEGLRYIEDGQYDEMMEVPSYSSREDLFGLLDNFLHKEQAAEAAYEFGERALKGTMERNLYRHRCEVLIRVIKGLNNEEGRLQPPVLERETPAGTDGA